MYGLPSKIEYVSILNARTEYTAPCIQDDQSNLRLRTRIPPSHMRLKRHKDVRAQVIGNAFRSDTSQPTNIAPPVSVGHRGAKHRCGRGHRQ